MACWLLVYVLVFITLASNAETVDAGFQVLDATACSSKAAIRAEQFSSNLTLLPGFLQPPILDHIRNMTTACVWVPSHGAGEDCVLGADDMVVRKVLSRLVETVSSRQCIKDPMSLPIRRFPSGTSEGTHAGKGPSYTILLHLSHGATVFHGQGPSGMTKTVPHAPGDVMAWWNFRGMPAHSGNASSGEDKLVVNLGLFPSEVVDALPGTCPHGTFYIGSAGLVGMLGKCLRGFYLLITCFECFGLGFLIRWCTKSNDPSETPLETPVE